MSSREQGPDFGTHPDKLVHEAEAAEPGSDPDAVQFINDRSTMLSNQVKKANEDDKNKVQLKPMGPLAASSTVVNLLLATGPFS